MTILTEGAFVLGQGSRKCIKLAGKVPSPEAFGHFPFLSARTD